MEVSSPRVAVRLRLVDASGLVLNDLGCAFLHRIPWPPVLAPIASGFIALGAVLVAGAAFAADGKPTKIDADISFSVAVRTMVRMDLCEGRYDPASLWLLRKYTLEDAAEISGRDINEILVEAKNRATRSATTLAGRARSISTAILPPGQRRTGTCISRRKLPTLPRKPWPRSIA